MRTIKVQVPRPVCVVVPPAALELGEKKRDKEGERAEQSVYLETWSCCELHPVNNILPVWASPVRKPGLCADGRGISHEETRGVQEASVTCGNPPARPKQQT